MNVSAVVTSENDYEDLLGQWSDLESGLGVVLSAPSNVREFLPRVVQYDRWMRDLMARDPDVGLYLLFQLAGNSPVGYSASHALVCATLCHLIAQQQHLQAHLRDSLVRAALTMNIAMTRLQDALAYQSEKPNPSQQEIIQTHPAAGRKLLQEVGITDTLWLAIVANHHDEAAKLPSGQASAVAQLGRVLRTVDRYAAMISPRMSRAGRTATESARALIASTSAAADEVAHALVQVVGLCPPGTFVRMETYVAVVGSADGSLLKTPVLQDTTVGTHQVRTALAAAAVQAKLNHFHILRLGAQLP
ncbi:MAG: phosphodiesterase [Burkholderiales bacterium PBB4]|nr:MAG: phosphodiesterase [Burkholderiales bacterium PBB4]